MRLFGFVLAAALPLVAQVNALGSKDIAEGWLMLFDGETTWGWTAEGGAKWKAAGGTLNSDGAESGWLRTTTQFADYVLKLEFQTAADGNSGVFLRAKKGAEPHKTGYELQIFDAHPKFPTGGIVEHAAPLRKARINPQRWHEFEIVTLGSRILVKLDGKKVVDLNDTKSLNGYIGLQVNKNKPIQFRNIRLRPLGLAPIFNGKNLSGWQSVQPGTPPAQPAEWTARKGQMHVLKGPGQLETKALFDDFVLQLDIRANSADPVFHPNSGIFLRGRTNAFWSGYEVQIRNEFKDNDRAKPVDFGTGGVYSNQPARRVVSSDNQFFTQTVIAQGRHVSTWVNGYPIADWEDTYPEADGTKGRHAQLKPGPISLQAHDPKTNLDFKNIRIRSLPK
ncbi:MAG: DUF1080 domain-containing protein [Bryobacterales bacterium]|nr:DUF1080 domain-containing protein [Bryobacterales bacterium]